MIPPGFNIAKRALSTKKLKRNSKANYSLIKIWYKQ